jgi:hypothetical protein
MAFVEGWGRGNLPPLLAFVLLLGWAMGSVIMYLLALVYCGLVQCSQFNVVVIFVVFEVCCTDEFVVQKSLCGLIGQV